MSDPATTPPRCAAGPRRRRTPAQGPESEYQPPPAEDMDIHLHPPAPGDPNNDNCSRVDWEQDGAYPGDFSFKGQPQKINKVLKIKYRAAVRQKDQYGNQDSTKPVLYWMTAYLLVAFEDGAG